MPPVNLLDSTMFVGIQIDRQVMPEHSSSFKCMQYDSGRNHTINVGVGPTRRSS